MQDELSLVLSIYRDSKKNFDIKQTPEVYITQKSNPQEVEEWLKDKCFAPKICAKLKGLSGHQIMGLKPEQLEKIVGPEEGKRLSSQISIQKNVSGFETIRSSELRAILAKARKKVETNEDKRKDTETEI